MPAFLTYNNVGLSRTEIWEASHGRVTERWPRAQLTTCQLQRGSPEQRPLISALLGCILAVPGGVFIQHTFILLTQGRPGNLRYEAVLLMLGLLGAWLIHEALIARRYYLLISTPSVTRKLVFASGARLEGIREFLAQATREYGLTVDDTQSPET